METGESVEVVVVVVVVVFLAAEPLVAGLIITPSRMLRQLQNRSEMFPKLGRLSGSSFQQRSIRRHSWVGQAGLRQAVALEDVRHHLRTRRRWQPWGPGSRGSRGSHEAARAGTHGWVAGRQGIAAFLTAVGCAYGRDVPRVQRFPGVSGRSWRVGA